MDLYHQTVLIKSNFIVKIAKIYISVVLVSKHIFVQRTVEKFVRKQIENENVHIVQKLF